MDGGMDLLFTVQANGSYELMMQLFGECSDYHCTYKEHALDRNMFAGLDQVQPFLLDSKGSGNPTIVLVKNGKRLLMTTNEGTV